MKIAVFRETGGVYLTEKGIFCKIRSRLAEVIPTAPYKLAETVFSVAVRTNDGIGIFGAPVCRTVAERGALAVFISKQVVAERKMIDSPAL